MLKKDLYNIRYALIPISLYCILMQIYFKTICPVKAFLKVDCPLCGMTRATIELLKFNIKESFKYNPMTIPWLIVISLFFIDRYIKKLKIKVFPYCFILISIITLIWYLIYKVKIV